MSPAITAPVTDADPAPATRSTARIRPAGEPAAAPSVDPDRPVLPQRRRMDHLIPQLAVPAADGGTASDEPTGTGPGRPAGGTDAGARRSQQALGALQRGTRDARRSDEGDLRDDGGSEVAP
jgi:hypothetical protein